MKLRLPIINRGGLFTQFYLLLVLKTISNTTTAVFTGFDGDIFGGGGWGW